MALTANEQLRDAEVSHQINMQRYGNGIVQRIIAVLNRSDARLFAAITEALDRLGPASFTVERLEQLLFSVRLLNKAAFDTVGRELTPDLRALVDYEAGYQYKLFQSVIPQQVLAQVTVASVNLEQTYAAALARPFQGTLLNLALDGLAEGRAKVIRQTLAQGYVEGKTVGQMVTELRGTRAKRYSDGIFNRSRVDVETVVRTATSHYAAFTRDRFMAANDDLIKAQIWTSTLDGRTSEPCIVRDLKQYTNDERPKPIGHSYPWGAGPGRFHWNCRSTSTPVLKSFRELGIPIDEFSPGTRASMSGQVAADQSYGEWLKKQSVKTQREVLGAERYERFAAGEPISSFANLKGEWYSLDELRARDAKAFERAGV